MSSTAGRADPATSTTLTDCLDVAIVGAGPTGLMAAEHLARAGRQVVVYERMPSPARKLLMAGRGGLNITHSEPLPAFLDRYRPAAPLLLDAIRAFPPEALIAWARGLGIDTYVGSSGRIFPTAMKASPLVRAWLTRLASLRVRLETGHHLVAIEGSGEDSGPDTLRLTFSRKGALPITVAPQATLLAVGGASWPRLGSDGSWVAPLLNKAIEITPLKPTNAGLLVPWSAHLVDRFAGIPLKRIVLTMGAMQFSGELIITRTGIEGTPAYAASSFVRDALTTAHGRPITVTLDLRPDLTLAELEARLSKPRGKQSLGNFLRKAAGITPLATALLREMTPIPGPKDLSISAAPSSKPLSTTPSHLAQRIKALPVPVTGLAGIERAISTAGGIAWTAIDPNFMLTAIPGVFTAGEMLDWEAPTGGYLLQGCFATAMAAATGMERYLQPLTPSALADTLAAPSTLDR